MEPDKEAAIKGTGHKNVLRRIEGVNRLDRVRNADIRERLNQEGILDRVKRSHARELDG